jgi:signal peptidase II
MNGKTENNQLRWLWLSAFIFLADQVSKYFVIKYLTLWQPKYLLPVLNFTFAVNTGASFSFLQDAGGWQRWLFIAIAVIVCVLILRWLQRLPRARNWAAGALALVLGGALGNLFDRVVRGVVIDFIQVYYQNWYYPTFNVADSAICIGIAIWIIISLKKNN